MPLLFIEPLGRINHEPISTTTILHCPNDPPDGFHRIHLNIQTLIDAGACSSGDNGTYFDTLQVELETSPGVTEFIYFLRQADDSESCPWYYYDVPATMSSRTVRVSEGYTSSAPGKLWITGLSPHAIASSIPIP